jgi:hypothetical protein
MQQQLAAPTAPALAQPQFTPQQLAQLQNEEAARNKQAQLYTQNPAALTQIQQSPNNLQAMQAMKVARAAEENMKPKQPAMRKGGDVKKKPVAAAKKTTTAKYAKGGMVMSNCGASMKPQQKRKK